MQGHLFTGQLVKLTAYKAEDIAVMEKWHEDDVYLRNVDTDIAFPKSKSEIESDLKSHSNSFEFALRTLDKDELIGFVAIHSIEWNNQKGLLAIGIGEAKNRNKGYGSDALKVILRYAFHELNLNRVGLDVIEYNPGGVRAYEKAGFKHEGRLRSAVNRDGKFYDLLNMGILRSEWTGAEHSELDVVK